MRIRSVVCAVVASAGMMGCMTATKFDPQLSTSCTDRNVCAVPVTVANCAISIPPDKTNLVMSGKPIVILWYLMPAAIVQKYTFDTTKGVVLKVDDPAAQFPTQEAVFNDHAYLWVNRNTNVKVYDYSINVVDSGGRACPTLDPKIYNH